MRCLLPAALVVCLWVPLRAQDRTDAKPPAAIPVVLAPGDPAAKIAPRYSPPGRQLKAGGVVELADHVRLPEQDAVVRLQGGDLLDDRTSGSKFRVLRPNGRGVAGNRERRDQVQPCGSDDQRAALQERPSSETSGGGRIHETSPGGDANTLDHGAVRSIPDRLINQRLDRLLQLWPVGHELLQGDDDQILPG